MASEIEVAKMAAVRIGTQASFLTLDDDRAAPRTLKAAWDIQRRATIREGSWNFAAKRAALPALASPGEIYPWDNAFELPADALRLIEVLGVSFDSYQLEGRRILADQTGPLYVRYAADVEVLAEWDEVAAEAFALRLAWKCGRKIAGSAFDEEAARAEYYKAIAEAKATDALENPSIAQEDGEWIDARLTGITPIGAPGWEIAP